MISLAIAILSLLAFGFSFTVRRVWVLVTFYVVYGVPKILATSDLLDAKALLLFRMLYAVLFVSFVARSFQDKDFLQRLRQVPILSYGFLVTTVILSICYSMVSAEKTSAWGFISLLSLFPLASWQMQRDEDFKIMAGAMVFVSLALSTWIIFLSATINFDFEARGGARVNQNFLSVWLMLGAFPLVQTLFTAKTKRKKLLAMLLLSVITFGAFLLASRGMLIAFIASLLSMAPMMVRRIGLRRSFVLGSMLLIVLSGSLLLPGAQGAVQRFADADIATFNSRTLIWGTALTQLEDSGPLQWLFGNGMSSGLRVLDTLTDDQWNYHNEYLGRLMDQGLLGLAAFLLFLAMMWRIVLKSNHPSKPVMIAWIVFLVVGGLSSTITDSHPFWIILGVCSGASVLAHLQVARKRTPWPRIWHLVMERYLAERKYLTSPAQQSPGLNTSR